MTRKLPVQFKKNVFEVTEEITDIDTGEIKKWTKKFTTRSKIENFYITYIDNLSGYMRLTANTDKSVLAYLCCSAEYDTGRVFLSPNERRYACDEIGICLQQFTNSLSKLKKLHLITGGNGFYMINPAIFWKGNSRTRESLLRDNKLAVEFNFEIYEDCE